MKENQVWLIARAIIAIVVILFTVYGFFIPQDCGVYGSFKENANLYCNLHPFKIIDGVGCVLWYGSAIMLTGLIKSISVNKWVVFIAALLGIILILA